MRHNTFHFKNRTPESGSAIIILILLSVVTGVIIAGIQFRSETLLRNSSIINLSSDLKHLRAYLRDRVSCSRTVTRALDLGESCGVPLFDRHVRPGPPTDPARRPAQPLREDHGSALIQVQSRPGQQEGHVCGQ